MLFFFLIVRKRGAQVSTNLALQYGILLQIFAKRKGYRLGITLHWEDDPIEIYGNQFVVSEGLKQAKLLMSFSGRDHFFLSPKFISHLSGEKLPNLGSEEFEKHPKPLEYFLSKVKIAGYSLSDQIVQEIEEQYGHFSSDNNLLETDPNPSSEVLDFTFLDRHVTPHRVANLYLKCRYLELGKPYEPYHKVFLEQRDYTSNDKHKKFMQHLVHANKAWIIGITHEGTKDFLNKALLKRGGKFWDELKIIFPSREVLKKIQDERSFSDRETQWVIARRDLIVYLLQKSSENRDNKLEWECLEYNGNLPFIGNYFEYRDGEKENLVRVAPLLPIPDSSKNSKLKVDKPLEKGLKRVYYMEIFQKMGDPYLQIHNAFKLISLSAKTIYEWTMFGEPPEIGRPVEFTSVVEITQEADQIEESRKRGLECCFPVVIVILFVETYGVREIFLQKRTEFNSTSDLGKFSNLGGRVIDLDLIDLADTTKFHKYNQKKSLLIENISETRTTLKPKISRLLQELEVIDRREAIPQAAWQRAGIREIKEELGLDLYASENRITFQHAETLNRMKEIKRHQSFKVFSLKLKTEELESIKQVRPSANLKPFSEKTLRQHHKWKIFNSLLQRRFYQVYMKIFKQLGVARFNWQLIGKSEGQKFRFHGIVERNWETHFLSKNSDAVTRPIYPVAMVILHFLDGEDRKMVLLLKDEYIASRDIDKLSNFAKIVNLQDYMEAHPNSVCRKALRKRREKFLEKAESCASKEGMDNLLEDMRRDVLTIISDMGVLSAGDILSENVWKKTRMRLTEEELCIKLDPRKFRELSSFQSFLKQPNEERQVGIPTREKTEIEKKLHFRIWAYEISKKQLDQLKETYTGKDGKTNIGLYSYQNLVDIKAGRIELRKNHPKETPVFLSLNSFMDEQFGWFEEHIFSAKGIGLL